MTRSRVEIDYQATGTYTHYLNGNVYTTYTSNVVDLFKQMNDVATPGYRSISRRGGIVNNGCSLVSRDWGSTGDAFYYAALPGQIYTSGGDGSYTALVASIFPPSIPPVFTGDVVSEAKAYALAHMDPSLSSALEDTFEIRSTLRLLRNPIGSLSNLAKSFRKQVNKTTRKTTLSRTKAIADVYLEYRFAFSPLVRSVVDITEAFGKENSIPPRMTARGTASDKDMATGTSVGTTFNFDYENKTEIEARAGILYTMNDPSTDWRRRVGFRWQDVPETMWAVMPYSFMVDRIVNVSNSIRGLTNLANPNLSILAAWVVTKRQDNLSYRVVKQHHYANPTVQGDLVFQNNFYYDRVVWTPTASDTVPVPQWDGLVKDASSIADLAALIVQRLK